MELCLSNQLSKGWLDLKKNWISGPQEKNSLSKRVSSLFYSPHIQENLEQHSKLKKLTYYLAGAAIGDTTFLLGSTTGLLTGLHEVVGHGLLGFKSIYHYQPGNGPIYWVQGWDNFRAIGKAHSFSQGVTSFFKWIIGYSSNDAEAAGWASSNHGRASSTSLHQAIGAHASDAWTSISGSIPGLLLDLSAVISGMHLKKRRPLLGGALVTFGLIDNLNNSIYPLSAATLSNKQLKQEARTGHDFANFAIQASDVTHISAHTIAVTTSVFWLTAVPLVALLTHLHIQSSLIESVSDIAAVKHWVKKAGIDPQLEKKLQAIWDLYFKKNSTSIPKQHEVFRYTLERLFQGIERHKHNVIKWDHIGNNSKVQYFTEFLLSHLSKKELKECKREILKELQKTAATDKNQTLLSVLTILSYLVSTAAQVLHALCDLGMHSLQTAASILSGLSCLGIAFSLFLSGKQAYKDVFEASESTPQMAKVLSVCRLIITCLSSALIIAMLFTPGINIALIAAIAACGVISIILNYMRTQYIKKQFTLLQAVGPDTLPFMQALLKEQYASKSDQPMDKRLKKWVALVQSDPKTAHLASREEFNPSLYRT